MTNHATRLKQARWAILVAGTCLVPQWGCATGFLPRHVDFIPRLQTSDTGLNGQAKMESSLPPAKAAVACLATAETLDKNGHPAQAIQQYELARQYGAPNVSRRLAVLYDRQGDFTRAMREYQMALQQTPKDPDLLNDFGYFHYERGAWLEAEKWLRQALQTSPTHATAAVNLAMTLGQEGKYVESFELFAKVVGEAEAHHNMGFVYQTHGKFEEAKQAYRKALAVRPDLSRAQQALAKLEKSPEDGKPLSNPKETPAGATPKTRDEIIAQRQVDEKAKEEARARLENYVRKQQDKTPDVETSSTPPALAIPQGISLLGPVKSTAPKLGRPESRD